MNILDASKSIRQAAEWLEDELERLTPGTREHAIKQLAWHHLVDAHTLIIKGRLTPTDLVRGTEVARSLLGPSPSTTAQEEPGG